MTKGELVSLLSEYDNGVLIVGTDGLSFIDDDGVESFLDPGLCIVDENEELTYLGGIDIIEEIDENGEFESYSESGLDDLDFMDDDELDGDDLQDWPADGDIDHN